MRAAAAATDTICTQVVPVGICTVSIRSTMPHRSSNASLSYTAIPQRLVDCSTCCHRGGCSMACLAASTNIICRHTAAISSSTAAPLLDCLHCPSPQCFPQLVDQRVTKARSCGSRWQTVAHPSPSTAALWAVAVRRSPSGVLASLRLAGAAAAALALLLLLPLL